MHVVAVEDLGDDAALCGHPPAASAQSFQQVAHEGQGNSGRKRGGAGFRPVDAPVDTPDDVPVGGLPGARERLPGPVPAVGCLSRPRCGPGASSG
ncbi:hypothetical protein Shyd_07560 [Streptomyces hydrogenans]|uniref:Uncharacterized protein n=1 Tax=Streptomyces hydrogenans TaxID=1873719 RepID=A0ABQ3P300_9ACTN|nr:hypothetical protein GCM10018784_68130 [Streptomyces hydrogenans]GHI19385.1 hypothetical protein Shyd_07560 [Streptomyces hydrogenans]